MATAETLETVVTTELRVTMEALEVPAEAADVELEAAQVLVEAVGRQSERSTGEGMVWQCLRASSK